MFKKDTDTIFFKSVVFRNKCGSSNWRKVGGISNHPIFFFAGIVPNEFIIDQAQREP
jgi:hypothetical protein